MFRNSIAKIKKHPYLSGIVAVGLIGFIVATLSGGDNAPEEAATNTDTTYVETMNVADYGNGVIGVAVPTAGGNSFVVRAETGGRVDSTIESGAVTKGTVIAELDNAAQRAALTQAQGAYEAAQAGAQQSDVSVESAQTAVANAEVNLLSAYKTAYTTANEVLITTIDDFFANPTTGQTPGLYIDGGSHTQTLNNERIAFRDIMSQWQQYSVNIDANDNLSARASEAINNMRRMTGMVDMLLGRVNEQTPGTTVAGADVKSYSATLSTDRATLNAQISALQNAESTLKTAEENLSKAQIGGTGSGVSAANAQVKQALGTLQSAQAAYEKTRIKAPFSGTITTMNVKVGDIINTGADIAIIVPEEGEETESSFVLPLTAVRYTPAGAYVFTLAEDNTLVAHQVETGLVSADNITVTGLSGSEVIVTDVRGLKSGDTVTIQ